MGILNNTSDGLYSMIAVLYRALAHLGTTPSERLLSLCTAGIPNTRTVKVSDALNRWTQLGLFVEHSGRIDISSDWKPPPGLDDIALNDRLRQAALHLALDETNVRDLWSTEGSADFARALAWWMAQDPKTFTGNVDSLLQLQNDQLDTRNNAIISNDVRMNRLKEWATFLGFTRPTPFGLELDPTKAVEMVLHRVLHDSRPIKADEFLEGLARELPVLDGGRWRKAVEKRLRPEVWNAPPDGWVSLTLAQALRQLKAAGVLAFTERADAGISVRVPRYDGHAAQALYQFTHVARAGT